MEERIRQRLEDYLSGSLTPGMDPAFDRALAVRPEEQLELNQFAEQSRLLHDTLCVSDAVGPSPGFYARVMMRVEEESRSSFWSPFSSIFGQRLVLASAMLLILVGVALVGTDSAPAETAAEVAEAPAQLLVDPNPDVHLVGNQDEDRGRVFATLASFEDFQ